MKNRKSIRLPFYDYSQPAQYFITTVVNQRKCFFGLPDVCTSEENELRELVESKWLDSFDRDIKLINHVIMPNHFHGLFEIVSDSQTEIDQ